MTDDNDGGVGFYLVLSCGCELIKILCTNSALSFRNKNKYIYIYIYK